MLIALLRSRAIDFRSICQVGYQIGQVKEYSNLVYLSSLTNEIEYVLISHSYATYTLLEFAALCKIEEIHCNTRVSINNNKTCPAQAHPEHLLIPFVIFCNLKKML